MPRVSKEKNAQYQREWYARNRELQKSRVRARDIKERARRKVILDELKSAPCADCGICFSPECMDFDHINGNKLDGVSYMALTRIVSWERVEAEIAKCEVVCANCHRTRTKQRRIAQR